MQTNSLRVARSLPAANKQSASTKPSALDRKLNITIVTGAIAPYTNRFYDALGSQLNVNLTVLVCEEIEPQRKWSVQPPRHYRLLLLTGLRYHASYTSHIYINPTVIRHLMFPRPDFVIIDGFSPTMMIAALVARSLGVPIGIGTDGSVATDPGQHSVVHRVFRNVFIPRAAAGFGASEDSLRLLENYGLLPGRGVVVPITAAWDGPHPSSFAGFRERPFDVLFSGSVDDNRKGALFFAQVVMLAAARGHKLKVRVAGDGPLRSQLEGMFRDSGISAQFDGYLQQEALPEAYQSARLLMFPSRGDPWGLVANEAVSCGTPVIASPHAVSGVELVERFGAGIVAPLDHDLWAKHVIRLTQTDEQAWLAHQACCPAACASFADAVAVDGMRNGIFIATGRDPTVTSNIGHQS